MNRQVFNPYLPLDVYIPDGEPHIYDERLYVFGSHDRENGTAFCTEPYQVWSAPISDLTDWVCHGNVYHASQDPDYPEKYKVMYAPDCVRGNDGRYYLYYAMAGNGAFTGPIHVAVSDSPGGKYEYYGAVRTSDGCELDQYITFDPAVINDGGKIWLYYGWSLDRINGSFEASKEEELAMEEKFFGKTRNELQQGKYPYMGANAVQLSDDMLTIEGEVSRIVPGVFEAKGTSFEGHAFFEGSSIRKIDDTYYFIYSSQWLHELCYATSKYPNKDFVYGGTIISNGDVGINNSSYESPNYVIGNNHGSIVEVNGQWYIFYHRHTHRNTFSRQGCAEKIYINKDGSIEQTEMTSCGLNDGPLRTEGTYPSAICCYLTNGKVFFADQNDSYGIPVITNDSVDRFITGIDDCTVVGYKYFGFRGRTKFGIKYRGNAEGVMTIKTDDRILSALKIYPSEAWNVLNTEFELTGEKALFLEFHGAQEMELLELSFDL